MNGEDRLRPTLLSIVVPVYFNAASLEDLHARLSAEASKRQGLEHEFVFVDDGSGDDSFAVLERLAGADPRVRVVRLSRNFGSPNACLAGLNYARGDCVVIVAADLQEPPDLPWRLLERWSRETPVVLAVRRSRDDERSRVMFARLYYRVMRWLAFPHQPREGFDCFLADRVVVDHLVAMDEGNTHLAQLVLWTGFAFAEVPYDRLRRATGRSRWTFGKRVKLFIDSIVAFSYFPMRALSAIGISLGFGGFLYAGLVVVRYLFAGEEVSGWSSLMVALLVLSGIQLIALGVLGEYLWRTLDAVRPRPNFLVAETRNVEAASPASIPAASAGASTAAPASGRGG